MSTIHINPKNKGKFNATKKATGKTTEELTHSSNPVTKKRAIFAQNAAKWHHAKNGMKVPSYAFGGTVDPLAWRSQKQDEVASAFESGVNMIGKGVGDAVNIAGMVATGGASGAAGAAAGGATASGALSTAKAVNAAQNGLGGGDKGGGMPKGIGGSVASSIGMLGSLAAPMVGRMLGPSQKRFNKVAEDYNNNQQYIHNEMSADVYGQKPGELPMAKDGMEVNPEGKLQGQSHDGPDGGIHIVAEGGERIFRKEVSPTMEHLAYQGDHESLGKLVADEIFQQDMRKHTDVMEGGGEVFNFDPQGNQITDDEAGILANQQKAKIAMNTKAASFNGIPQEPIDTTLKPGEANRYDYITPPDSPFPVAKKEEPIVADQYKMKDNYLPEEIGTGVELLGALLHNALKSYKSAPKPVPSVAPQLDTNFYPERNQAYSNIDTMQKTIEADTKTSSASDRLGAKLGGFTVAAEKKMEADTTYFGKERDVKNQNVQLQAATNEVNRQELNQYNTNEVNRKEAFGQLKANAISSNINAANKTIASIGAAKQQDRNSLLSMQAYSMATQIPELADYWKKNLSGSGISMTAYIRKNMDPEQFNYIYKQYPQYFEKLQPK